MAAMKTISAALKLIDIKKQNLHKAFEDLQSQSSSLSSFNLKWSDLDSHFSSIQSSLETQFQLLQSQPQPKPKPSPDPDNPARPELISFCENMDGFGLRQYICERPRDRDAIRAELRDAFRYAPDAATMVLEAMEGFYGNNSKVDRYLGSVAVVMLDELTRAKVEIGGGVRERARDLAAEWKGKVRVYASKPLEALGFLHLVGAYGLEESFDAEELMDLVVTVKRFEQATELCRVLGFGDRMPDLISKLISKGKRLLAVRFVFEFELTDKFPPVPLLKQCVTESRKEARRVWKGGKHSLQSHKASTANELSALKSVFEIIQDHKLESEFPNMKRIRRRIDTLERLEERRCIESELASLSQHQPRPQKLSENKRPRTTAAAGPAEIPKSTAAANLPIPAFQQSHLQPAGLFPDQPTPYSSSPAGPYGLAGSTPGVAPYAGSSAGLYGSEGAPLGVPGNLTPAQPHVYPSESHMPSGYDRPITYGGYGFPRQYHPR